MVPQAIISPAPLAAGTIIISIPVTAIMSTTGADVVTAGTMGSAAIGKAAAPSAATIAGVTGIAMDDPPGGPIGAGARMTGAAMDGASGADAAMMVGQAMAAIPVRGRSPA